MKRNPLSRRQQAFIIEYLKDKNGTRAAIRAGYPEKSARVEASKLLTKPNIFQPIADSIAGQLDKAEINGVRVLRELYRILTVDIAGAFEDNGALKSIQDIPEDIRRAISGIEVDEIWDTEYEDGKKRTVQIGETKKVKFWSKTEAAQLLGKHLKLWVENAGGINFLGDGPVLVKLDIKT